MKVAKREAPKAAAPRPEAQTARDPGDRRAGSDEREELDECDVAVPAAEDHRHRRLDLRSGREDVDPAVGRIRDVPHRLLLLPQRGTREVVEHRVREALGNRQSNDERVSVRQDSHRREDRDRPVAQRLPHRRDEHERRSRPSTNRPCDPRKGEPATEDDEKSCPGQRVGG